MAIDERLIQFEFDSNKYEVNWSIVRFSNIYCAQGFGFRYVCFVTECNRFL